MELEVKPITIVTYDLLRHSRSRDPGSQKVNTSTWQHSKSPMEL